VPFINKGRESIILFMHLATLRALEKDLFFADEPGSSFRHSCLACMLVSCPEQPSAAAILGY